jgi:hypothetical protein
MTHTRIRCLDMPPRNLSPPGSSHRFLEGYFAGYQYEVRGRDVVMMDDPPDDFLNKDPFGCGVNFVRGKARFVERFLEPLLRSRLFEGHLS